MKRCQHEPVMLFDRPQPELAERERERAGVLYFMSGYARRGWVICRKCGETGYWGGYGFKRRVRWGYGGESVLQTAEQHNRAMRGGQQEPTRSPGAER